MSRACPPLMQPVFIFLVHTVATYTRTLTGTIHTPGEQQIHACVRVRLHQYHSSMHRSFLSLHQTSFDTCCGCRTPTTVNTLSFCFTSSSFPSLAIWPYRFCVGGPNGHTYPLNHNQAMAGGHLSRVPRPRRLQFTAAIPEFLG